MGEARHEDGQQPLARPALTDGQPRSAEQGHRRSEREQVADTARVRGDPPPGRLPGLVTGRVGWHVLSSGDVMGAACTSTLRTT